MARFECISISFLRNRVFRHNFSTYQIDLTYTDINAEDCGLVLINHPAYYWNCELVVFANQPHLNYTINRIKLMNTFADLEMFV